MTQARSLLAPCLSHSKSQGLSKEQPGRSQKKMRPPNPYVLVGRCIFQLRQGFGKESLSLLAQIIKELGFVMFHFADCAGWATSKPISVFFYHFVAEGAHIFWQASRIINKNDVFLKVRLLMASKKTGRQKKVYFVAALALFFDSRFGSPANSRKLSCPRSSIGKAMRHATEARQAREARHGAGRLFSY